MGFSFNWRPQQIPTQLKGTATLPEIEQPFDFTQYFTNLVNREEMDGYHPAGNFSVPNQQHGGNAPVNYNGYQPTTPLTEDDIVSQNLNERQVGNANDMANWIQQGGTPVADAQAAVAQQAEQEAAAKQQRIAEIEAEITEIKNRMAERKNAMAANEDDLNSQLAGIEARKINSKDPTMFWRWKVGQDQQRELAKQAKSEDNTAKANAMIEIANDLDSIVVDASMDSATQKQYLSKLANLKTLAQKNGLPIDSIDAKIKEVKGDNSGEQTSREKAKTDWKGLKGKPDLTSKEIQTALDNHDMNWDPDERKEAENLRDKLKKHEAAAQSVKNMKNWLLTNYGIDYNQLEPDEQKSWQEIWKAQK